MGKSKDKSTKKAKGAEISARPTFEFDLDFEEKDTAMRRTLDNVDDDDISIASSASQKMMKKVKNIMSMSFHKPKNVDLDDQSSSTEFRKKKANAASNNPHPPAIIDFIDAGPDDRSKSKKKKKKGSKATLGGSKSSVAANGGKKSKRKKKKPKTDDDDDDDDSVGTSRSTRSKKSFKKGKPKSGEMLGMSLELLEQRRMREMEIENAALLEETATVRRQLNDSEKALKKALSQQSPQQGNFDQIRELEIAHNESRELKVELEEYEDAVIEKDQLIQKLTEAVDAQLDKVESLEVKLVRAEEEFCKMEEEMQEMEDVIADLRSGTPGQVDHDQEHDGNYTNSGGEVLDKQILEELEKRERNIEKREQDLLEKEDYVLERETLIKQQDEDLKKKRSSLLKPQQPYSPDREINGDDNFPAKRDTSNDVNELEAKIIQLEAENNDLSEEIECLRQHDTRTREQEDRLTHQHDKELESLQDKFDKKIADSNQENEILLQELDILKEGTNSDVAELKSLRNSFDKKIADSTQENEILRQELDILKQGKNFSDKELESLGDNLDKKILNLKEENEILRQELKGFKEESYSDDKELKSLRDKFDKKMADSKLENEILQKELDSFKQRKNSENEDLRQQIEELRKQKTHVEASSRQMRRMESMRMMEPENLESLDDDGEFGLEVEVEIAELREKIVEQEERSRKLKQEIAAHVNENEEIKQELQERELEMKELENQLAATKEASTRKMKQKDETITFMQNTMMEIMQEKQQLDKKSRGSNLDRAQADLMKNSRANDEAEKARLEAINAELRKLDDENRLMEDELKQVKYKRSLELKEKQSIILELQEELSDVKWELGAREKGADYITLLKDRKERKNQLNKARKELKEAEVKILELELQNSDLLSNKKDLEKEVESLTKSALSEDSGEQISGLKRQIKSLKQHNTALERKLDAESRDSEERAGEKEAKIRILEFELQKLRNPAQTAIRGVVSGFIPGFGRTETEFNNESTTEDEGAKSTKTENTDRTAKDTGKPGKIWSLFGQRKDLPKTADNDVGNEKDSMIKSPDAFEVDETL